MSVENNKVLVIKYTVRRLYTYQLSSERQKLFSLISYSSKRAEEMCQTKDAFLPFKRCHQQLPPNLQKKKRKR